MSAERPFGLDGDPEVREARRRSFGGGNSGVFLLVIATFLGLDQWPSLNLAGQVVFLLSAPVLVYGWAAWWKTRRQGGATDPTASAASVALWLRLTAGVVSAWTLNRPLDRWDAGFSLLYGAFLLSLLVRFFIRRPAGQPR